MLYLCYMWLYFILVVPSEIFCIFPVIKVQYENCELINTQPTVELTETSEEKQLHSLSSRDYSLLFFSINIFLIKHILYWKKDSIHILYTTFNVRSIIIMRNVTILVNNKMQVIYNFSTNQKLLYSMILFCVITRPLHQ